MSVPTDCIELLSPAKVNLMLSVHGPQADGFHALTSVVVALDFGDRLSVQQASSREDVLRCADPSVPTGIENLVVQAAALFRETVGKPLYYEFELEKSIPMGAGLGGGSSNASTALLAMNSLAGEPLSKGTLMELAAQLGSDCPFFIDPRPSLMKGRGELIEPLADELADVLRGQSIVLFRPDFAVNTAWAYGQLREHAPDGYEDEGVALNRFLGFERSQDLGELLFNSFEPVVVRKYVSVACILTELREKEVQCLMSGSGSCCFAILKESNLSSSHMHGICRNAWGSSVFWVVTSVT
ncbi:MAG: 4-(cytidine 5'-diphospho)-2-C-methyl-D-erythritol kinase [Lentimonas sp.]